MSKTTPKLGLFEYDPSTDGAQTFNIEKALNENWEKLDGLTPEQIGAAATSDLDTKVKISWYDGDLNTLYSDGHYRLGGNVTNGPATVADKGAWGNLLVVQGTNTDSCLQLLVDMSGNTFSRRVSYNATGTPGAWQKLATSTDLAGKSDTSHSHAGQSINPTSLELNPGTSAGPGGYIDFHYNGSTADYTSRIIESASGKINIQANVQVSDQAVGVDCVRNISSGTRDLTAGSSGCGTGKIYLVYE